jgi:hypothetical protein
MYPSVIHDVIVLDLLICCFSILELHLPADPVRAGLWFILFVWESFPFFFSWRQEEVVAQRSGSEAASFF